MKRLAGWAAITALVAGLLGLGWWLWPHWQSDAPQRPSAAFTSASPRQLNASAPAAMAKPSPPRSPNALPGSCKAWFGTL